MRSSNHVVITALAAVSIVSLGALGACGSSSSGGGGPGDGEACSATTPCGDGSVCDLTDPAGAKCIDSDGDLDGDGIPNSMDKCDHMPGGMFDEDGDGIGDECDKCPIAKPPATPDTDNDGVDSPCDPNPTTDGEQIVLFNGFNGTALPTGWVATPATWSVTGGEAIVVPASDTASNTLLAPLTLSTTHTVVMTAYRVDNVTSTTEADAAVTAAQHLPLGDTVAQCGGLRTGTVDQLQVKTSNGSITKEQANLFDAAGLYKVAMQLEGAAANCAMVANTENGAVQGQINGFRPNQAGLVAQGGKMRFEYLLVVQKP
ncbi:MAG TPA: hypothetical protein VGC42_13760 [Kofleriaceae bacterium]